MEKHIGRKAIRISLKRQCNQSSRQEYSGIPREAKNLSKFLQSYGLGSQSFLVCQNVKFQETLREFFQPRLQTSRYVLLTFGEADTLLDSFS